MTKVLYIILFLSLVLNSIKIEAIQCQKFKAIFCGRSARCFTAIGLIVSISSWLLSIAKLYDFTQQRSIDDSHDLVIQQELFERISTISPILVAVFGAYGVVLVRNYVRWLDAGVQNV